MLVVVHTYAKLCCKLHGCHPTPVVLQFEDICEAVEISRAVKSNPYRTILKRRYWPQLVMSVMIPIFQQLTGINAIMVR